MSEVQWGYAAPPPAPAPSSGRRRIWIIAAAIVTAVCCICTVAAGFSCPKLYSIGEKERVRQIVMTIEPQLRDHPRAEEYTRNLRALETLENSDGISLIAFTVLWNRFTDVTADGSVSTDEMDRLMEVITDIEAGHGSIDVNRYPNAR